MQNNVNVSVNQINQSYNQNNDISRQQIVADNNSQQKQINVMKHEMIITAPSVQYDAYDGLRRRSSLLRHSVKNGHLNGTQPAIRPFGQQPRRASDEVARMAANNRLSTGLTINPTNRRSKSVVNVNNSSILTPQQVFELQQKQTYQQQQQQQQQTFVSQTADLNQDPADHESPNRFYSASQQQALTSTDFSSQLHHNNNNQQQQQQQQTKKRNIMSGPRRQSSVDAQNQRVPSSSSSSGGSSATTTGSFAMRRRSSVVGQTNFRQQQQQQGEPSSLKSSLRAQTKARTVINQQQRVAKTSDSLPTNTILNNDMCQTSGLASESTDQNNNDTNSKPITIRTTTPIVDSGIRSTPQAYLVPATSSNCELTSPVNARKRAASSAQLVRKDSLAKITLKKLTRNMSFSKATTDGDNNSNKHNSANTSHNKSSSRRKSSSSSAASETLSKHEDKAVSKRILARDCKCSADSCEH